MNHEGVGIAREQSKVCFVEGALLGETVLANVVEEKKNYLRLHTKRVLSASEYRIDPSCPHYKFCGGCQLQHFDASQQVVSKQEAVGQLFKKFAKVDIQEWQDAIASSHQYYRRTARIAVYFDRQKSQYALGFRQHNSKKIINISQCHVLDSRFKQIFSVFSELLPCLKNGQAITHLQIYGVDKAYVIVRHIKPLPKQDIDLINQVGIDNQWKMVMSPERGIFKSLDNIDNEKPYYQINSELKLSFNFDNFIQVNDQVNQQMIAQSLDWLNISRKDNVLDLFCGIGNFSLAIAKKAQHVVGVEGVDSAIAMAKYNAKQNDISNCEFYCQDLTQQLKNLTWFKANYQILVLDPSRTGAYAVLEQLPLNRFNRILYVSCDPVTLARDSKLILNSGFNLSKISLMNMFPHTKHIETMVLFDKNTA